MPTLQDDPKSIFSPRAIHEAHIVTGDEKVDDKRKVELNELAKQVAEQFSSDVVAPGLITGFCRIFEFLGLLSLGLLGYVLYVMPQEAGNGQYLFASILGSFLTIAAIQAIDGYQMDTYRNFMSQISKVITGFGFAMIVLLIMGFFRQG